MDLQKFTIRSDLDDVQTQSNLAGTPRYMAPEAYRDELCTEKIDIYSFAMLTWEMLTGQVSFLANLIALSLHSVFSSVTAEKKCL